MSLPSPSPGRPLAGILFLLAALVLLPLMDGCAKLLSQRLSVFEITWARYTIHWVLLLPLLIARHGWSAFRPALLGMQLARSTTLLVGTVLFFFGLSYMPVADTLALFFVSPLVATALSPWILGEKVGPRRYAAVLIGFVGALIIFRPGIGVFRWPALFPFASGFAVMVMMRRRDIEYTSSFHSPGICPPSTTNSLLISGMLSSTGPIKPWRFTETFIAAVPFAGMFRYGFTTVSVKSAGALRAVRRYP